MWRRKCSRIEGPLPIREHRTARRPLTEHTPIPTSGLHSVEPCGPKASTWPGLLPASSGHPSSPSNPCFSNSGWAPAARACLCVESRNSLCSSTLSPPAMHASAWAPCSPIIWKQNGHGFSSFSFTPGRLQILAENSSLDSRVQHLARRAFKPLP